ncbi:GTP cyclohydrolase FolE2 [Gynuella sp.]|uniref:GTP cyclohydrolase FolE2 n=1 Tax=Gynuella sp. TaxID=2969146 RepID=UPI003D09B60A
MHTSKTLPDITKTQQVAESLPLRWVGMEAIAVPITFDLDHGNQQTMAAKADVYVSLDDLTAKGIHMSRLHALLNELAAQSCNKDTLDLLLEKMVTSQAGISQNAKINLAFDLLLPKPSLLSHESGFQTYRVEIKGQRIKSEYDYSLKITVPYSSTCPCSAALSRQLLADAIDTEFPTANIDKQALLSWAQSTSVATPHSQRSYAYLTLSLGNHQWPALPSLIFQIEEAIGTPVQTMVKRADEQEFARLNAEHLMFCEDAARKLKAMLEQSTWVLDYRFKVKHQESLHAHNAVVIDQKHASTTGL